jgi:hypothetical protein
MITTLLAVALAAATQNVDGDVFQAMVEWRECAAAEALPLVREAGEASEGDQQAIVETAVDRCTAQRRAVEAQEARVIAASQEAAEGGLDGAMAAIRQDTIHEALLLVRGQL